MERTHIVRGMVVMLCVALGATLMARTAYALDTAALANEVFNLVNKERRAVGVSPLTRAVELDRAAQKYARYMAEARFFSHDAPDGTSPSTRLMAEGYRGTICGENLAAGQPTPQTVMTAWMNSSGHRSNILHPSFNEIGIGCAVIPGSPLRIYWVKNFGLRERRDQTPAATLEAHVTQECPHSAQKRTGSILRPAVAWAGSVGHLRGDQRRPPVYLARRHRELQAGHFAQLAVRMCDEQEALDGCESPHRRRWRPQRRP
jgi:uncharacterized protein YkwD